MQAIQTSGLTKEYPGVVAVNGIDLHVETGEIYGFLGLNGAGKTTTIRALLGMVKPTAGDIHVLGQQLGPHGQGPWARVGHMVEAPTAYPQLSVYENLLIASRHHHGVDRSRIDDVIDQLKLNAYVHRKAGVLSTGNSQRLGLAKALLHKPELLLLDEPTNGLDPAGVVEIRRLLRQLASGEGMTVFMSSHILTEVSRLADRIGIIHEGKMIEEYDAETINNLRSTRLVIQVQDPVKAKLVLETEGYTVAEVEGALHVLDEIAIGNPEKVATYLVNSGNPPSKLNIEQEDLESHFLSLTGVLA
ncbi:MAG: ABC transporter ATP-binding protein [Candidatus Marinimicrobia bacterium]|nr:ABC transporter ATP-binding protein [Candidatus Neomarinimicrobiota bacterium]MCF7851118.1 ABC transporter ATP-binding protein [Candidatus Neomarinimicrobiota bacterium]MCF7904334.1 ABC transporter ATP-binding protein [Candidatus Neomarinimicrobiota bacterium]